MDLNKYLVQTEKSEVKNWISTTLNSYINKKNNPENQGEIEHVIDFMNSDKAPKRLSKMSYPVAVQESKKWVKALAKKGKDIDDTADIKVVKKFRNGFKLVKLVGKPAFEREGFLMSHCVASYFGKTETNVYSLRDEKNMPHATIEVTGDNDNVNQIKGKGNGSIHPNYIKMVIEVIKKFGVEVRSSEMQNLGYATFTNVEEKILKMTETKIETFSHKKQKYYYVQGRK